MNQLLLLILLTLAPFFELRASIPYGIVKTDLSVLSIVLLAVFVNIILAVALFFLLHYAVNIFRYIGFIDRMWKKIILRAQRKVHPYVEKYGVIGLAMFIGVPLPGSGVYTGAIGATALGFEFKDFFVASIIGVCIAATAVTIISLFGEGVWLTFLK